VKYHHHLFLRDVLVDEGNDNYVIIDNLNILSVE